ncbi:nuclear transport factor 2 family protein [Salinisphaera aquimarina]|uniref:Nuclear transport factor 2 family protein n=1 Tax=Salinisphaera aquimarina TaxID=2094031 RepID=A0ABV7EQ77_9GAMM
MKNPVQAFFACLADGDAEGALAQVHEQAVFEAQGPERVPIYGVFEGHTGVRRFLATLGELFDTEALDIHQWAEAGDTVFAHGRMQHQVRRTDRTFACEWALVCRLANGRIISYKMFEDTAALVAAYTD